MKNDNNYSGILLEAINDKVEIVVEAVGQMQDTMKTLATQKNLDRVEAKVDTIQIALTETNKDLRLHDLRISKLERAV